MTDPPQPPTVPDLATAAARIPVYELSMARLERALGDYLRRTPLYRRFFFGLTAAGFACFAFGVFPGIWGSMSATLVSVAGYAMLKTRVWELRVEIEETRDEIERLRTGSVTARARPRW